MLGLCQALSPQPRAISYSTPGSTYGLESQREACVFLTDISIGQPTWKEIHVLQNTVLCTSPTFPKKELLSITKHTEICCYSYLPSGVEAKLESTIAGRSTRVFDVLCQNLLSEPCSLSPIYPGRTDMPYLYMSVPQAQSTPVTCVTCESSIQIAASSLSSPMSARVCFSRFTKFTPLQRRARPARVAKSQTRPLMPCGRRFARRSDGGCSPRRRTASPSTCPSGACARPRDSRRHPPGRGSGPRA